MANRRQRMLATLVTSDTCTLCGLEIDASQIVRLDAQRCLCPHCGGEYIPRSTWSQLGG